MLFYCLKCQKSTENINWKVSNANNGKIMLLSRLMKEQEAKEY